MIEVRYEQGKYKLIKIDEREGDRFLTYMFLDTDEANELVGQIADINWRRIDLRYK